VTADGSPAGLIASLHTLRQQALVVQTAAATDGLTPATAASFVRACAQASRAVLDHASVINVAEDEQSDPHADSGLGRLEPSQALKPSQG
jgi:hypothetical protein